MLQLCVRVLSQAFGGLTEHLHVALPNKQASSDVDRDKTVGVNKGRQGIKV